MSTWEYYPTTMSNTDPPEHIPTLDYVFDYEDGTGKTFSDLKFLYDIHPLGFGMFSDKSGHMLQLLKKNVHLNDEGKRLLRDAMRHPMDDVAEFHAKFGLAYDGPPRVLDDEMQILRDTQLDEELTEYAEAPDDEARFDALIDLVYFAIGTCVLRGWDFREGWRRVHARNMLKERAKSASDSKRGSQFDVVKPPGWIPADLSDLVRIPEGGAQ